MWKLTRMSVMTTIGWAIATSLTSVERARAQPPVDCGTATGDCFAVNATPGCDDTVTTDGLCCEQVCDEDPYCCSNPWDNICVATAFDICNLPLGACCNFNGNCSDGVQQRFCKGEGVGWFEGKICPKYEEEVGPDEIVCGAVPTVSEWGLIVMTLLGCTIGTVVFGRRRRAAQQAT